jgi:hyperosmotically inducible periplasmic protein
MAAGIFVLLLWAGAVSAAAQRPDQQLVRDIERQVLTYPHFTIFDSIHVQVEQGVVILTGKVTMPFKRKEIEARVAGVSGVAEVRNRLDVLPVSQFDDDLRFRIARAIYTNAAFRSYASMPNPPIHIIVENGRVTLEGVVNSNVDRMLARSIASSFDAFEVRNELQTVDEARRSLER